MFYVRILAWDIGVETQCKSLTIAVTRLKIVVKNSMQTNYSNQNGHKHDLLDQASLEGLYQASKRYS